MEQHVRFQHREFGRDLVEQLHARPGSRRYQSEHDTSQKVNLSAGGGTLAEHFTGREYDLINKSLKTLGAALIGLPPP
jgi:hypothetical protein